MSFKILLAALAAASLIAEPAEAQILGRIRQRVQDRVNGAVERAVDRTVDRAADAVTAAPGQPAAAPAQPAATPAAGPAATPAQPGGTAATPAATPPAAPASSAEPVELVPLVPPPAEPVELVPLVPPPAEPVELVPLVTPATEEVELVPLTPPTAPEEVDLVPLTPPDAPEEVDLVPLVTPETPGRAVETVHLQHVAPLRLRVQVRWVWEDWPDCVIDHVYQGTLSPVDAGRRLQGVMEDRAVYVNGRCPVLGNGEPIAWCSGDHSARYDAVAMVSGVRLPEDANPASLTEFAAGKSSAWSSYGLQVGPDGTPGREIIRTRLGVTLTYQPGSVQTTDSCILASEAGRDGWDREYSGRGVMRTNGEPYSLSLPAILIPEEGESTETVHAMGGGNEIRVSVIR